MRQIITGIVTIMAVMFANAQNDVTKFLGIPVDGTKSEMIQKLKAKGFKPSKDDKEILEGEFNGTYVNVYIGTNNNKVCRIMLCDAIPVDEQAIKIRFNDLCRQFEKNKKYEKGIFGGEYIIPDDEKIAFEMTVNNKRYEAVFYQQPDYLSDSTLMRKKILSELLKKYTVEQINNPTKEISMDIFNISLEYSLKARSKNPVWFKISERFGRYIIVMYYDNEENRANGEDL